MKKITAVAIIGVLVAVAFMAGSGGAIGQEKDSLPEARPESEAVPAEIDETEKPAAASKKVTFVELGSLKCIPCKKMQPIMTEIEAEYGDQVEIVFVDVWTEAGKESGQKYKIRVIPTQVFLDADGKEYYRHEGFFPKEELVKVLKQGGVE